LHHSSKYTWPPDVNADSLLKLIRKEIKKAPIDLTLLKLVNAQLAPGISYRFRSSSNAEDLANFNGAGLYDSYSGIKGDSIKTVENAIKKVWASVFNAEAFTERKLFNMAESSVAMAVLVHQGFPTEEANGVAITKNLFRSGGAGFTINVQIGEESVVAPRDTVQCEQMVIIAQEIFFGDGNKVYPQYIARSNMTTKPVLTASQIEQLYFALEKIKWINYAKLLKLYGTLEYENFALDIEFKFDKGKLFIKQVRPFNG
jgi:pyruvate, water dikinase